MNKYNTIEHWRNPRLIIIMNSCDIILNLINFYYIVIVKLNWLTTVCFDCLNLKINPDCARAQMCKVNSFDWKANNLLFNIRFLVSTSMFLSLFPLFLSRKICNPEIHNFETVGNTDYVRLTRFIELLFILLFT